MKLISMTDYVFEQKRPIPSADLHEMDYYYKEYEIVEKIFNYANFLKQPLKLGMFVPCDENDVPLDEPKDYEHNVKKREYQQAKERVIFEGFEKYSPQLLCEMFNAIEEITKLDITITDSVIKKYNL